MPLRPSEPLVVLRTALLSGLVLSSGVADALADAPAGEPSLAQRQEAARAAADQAAACVAAQPFYWEIGNAAQTLASGSAGEKAPQRNTPMAIASASKWIYAAFVAERRQGQLTEPDIAFLHFQSGFSRFHNCRAGQTVAACQEGLINGRGRADPSTAGRFDYSGGHMQKHAVLMGLGPQGNDGLALAVRQSFGPVLGSDWAFDYFQPQPAGGGKTDPASYASFLRALVSKQLQLGHLLGRHAVCTNPIVCPAQAVKTPIPLDEAWHYSLGHWVEDDPRVGDGAFSSPGAFGFYPWVSADRQTWGLLAREQRHGVMRGDPSDKPAIQSVACGRKIRAAWALGRPGS